MAYHAHGGLPEAGFRALHRAGRRMVNLGPAAQAPLKGLRIFAYIV